MNFPQFFCTTLISGCRKEKQYYCENECTPITEMCKLEKKCDVKAMEICKSSNEINETKCVLNYDSFDRLKTIVNYPFMQLYDCEKTSCEAGEYLCPGKKFCISIELICDGINHCFYNEDEMNCRKLQFSH